MNQNFSLTPIIILHGWTLEQNTQLKWQPFINELEKIGLKVEFLKIPGLSEPSKPLTKTWTLADYRLWLKNYLSGKSEPKKFILLGHSFGGQLAASFSAHSPQLVKALILIDSAGIRDKAGLPGIKKLVFKFLAKFGKKIISFFSLDKLSLKQLLRKFLYKLAREKDYLESPENLRKTLSNILEADIQAELSQVQVPTLIIWGQKDTMTPLTDGKLFNQRINNSQLKVVADAKHSPQYTHLEETIALIKSFLKGLK